MLALRFAFTFAILTAAFAAFSAPAQKPSAPFNFEVPTGWKAMPLGEDGAIVSSGDAYVRIVKAPGGGKDDQQVQKVVDQIRDQWMQFKLDERGQAKLAGSTGIYLFLSGVNPKGVEATMRIVAAPFGDDAYMLVMSAPTKDFLNLKEAFKQIEHTFALTSGAPRPATGGELPAHPGVNGLKAVDEPGGGRVLFTTLSGVSSGVEAFQAGVAKTRGYFDSTPKLLSAVTSKDHNLTICVFTAALHGSPVTGLARSAYDPAGNSHFAVVFDSPDHLKTSLTPMMRHVDEMVKSAIERTRPAGGGPSLDFAKFEAASAHVALKQEQYPGGIGSIGIASGYTPRLQGSGTCIAMGEDGSYMNLMGFDGMCDPRGSLYKSQQLRDRLAGGKGSPIPDQRVWIEYDPNPVSAWKKFVTENARLRGTPDANPQVLHEEPMKGVSGGWTGKLVSGTITVKGETFAFTGSLMTSPPPPPVGSWSLGVTILAAPIKNAAKDFPALIAMQKSVRLDLRALQDNANRFMARMNEQTSRWMAENKAAGDAARDAQFESSMAHAQTVRDIMDRSTAGFINYVLDRSVVQNKETGKSATVPNDLASALTQSDPKNLSVVPTSDLVKGVHF